ncbi:hypothetical protein ABPG75_012416 [Micractinium tetrahymenae]
MGKRRPGLATLPWRLAKGGRRRATLSILLLTFLAAMLVRRRSRQAADTATAAAVLAGAGVHGFVDKAGPLDPQQWQVGFKEWRQNRTQEWVAQRQALLAAGKPPPPLQTLSACQVLVNHLYKIVYLRHAKTASSSLLCHFRGCHGTEGEGPVNATLSFEPLQMLTGKELEDFWRSYFVVTFVRNSYQRAVSSYRMMMRNFSPAGSASYGWNDFCADPAGFADVCVSDRLCAKKGADFVWDHIQPQADCMLAAGGGWAVDFIRRTEHIDEDLAALLEELELRRPTDAPPVRPLEKRLENVNGRGCNEAERGKGKPMAREQYCDPADYFTGQHAACFAGVQQQYSQNVLGLRFGPHSTAQRQQRLQQAAGRRAAAGAAQQRSLQQQHSRAPAIEPAPLPSFCHR